MLLPPAAAAAGAASSGQAAQLQPLRRLSCGYVTWSRQYTEAHRNQGTTAKSAMAEPRAVALVRSRGWWEPEDRVCMLLQSARQAAGKAVFSQGPDIWTFANPSASWAASCIRPTSHAVFCCSQLGTMIAE